MIKTPPAHSSVTKINGDILTLLNSNNNKSYNVHSKYVHVVKPHYCSFYKGVVVTTKSKDIYKHALISSFYKNPKTSEDSPLYCDHDALLTPVQEKMLPHFFGSKNSHFPLVKCSNRVAVKDLIIRIYNNIQTKWVDHNFKFLLCQSPQSR